VAPGVGRLDAVLATQSGEGLGSNAQGTARLASLLLLYMRATRVSESRGVFFMAGEAPFFFQE